MSFSLAVWSQIYLYPLLVTLALWGGLTVGLFWLNKRGKAASRWVLLFSIPLLVLAHSQLWEVRYDMSVWGCYSAFVAGMLIWTWHELAFYSGVLTGPWRSSCPSGVSDWQRFGYAVGTHLYHEAAVVLEMIMLWWILHDATNFIGPLTFGLMWALQHSAKCNVFLGVRHLQVSLFPEHLRYLGSFWRKRTCTSFFVVSVLASSLLAVVLWLRASQIAPDSQAVGMTLLAALTTLGALEHWLLVLPPGTGQQIVLRKGSRSKTCQWKTSNNPVDETLSG